MSVKSRWAFAAIVLVIVLGSLALYWSGKGLGAGGAALSKGEAMDAGRSGPELLLAAERREAARGALVSGLERSPAGSESLHSLLGAAKEALEDGRYAEFGELLSRAFVDFHAVCAHVERLIGTDLEEGEQEVMLWALGILIEIRADLPRLNLSHTAETALDESLSRLFESLLSNVEELPDALALEILVGFATAGVLGLESLDFLHGLLPRFAYREELCRAVLELALRADPPRHELVMDLIHHGDDEVRLMVARALGGTDTALSLDLALGLIAELEPDSHLRVLANELIAAHAEPQFAFDHLAAETSVVGHAGLLHAAIALGHRGLHREAFERYLEEPRGEVRSLLVFAGKSDTDFLEHVLDSETDFHPRGVAALNLASTRPDERTGARFVDELTKMGRQGFQPNTPGSVYAEVLVEAVRSYLGAAPPHSKNPTLLAALRSSIDDIQHQPNASEALKQNAQRVLLLLGG